MTAFYPRNAIRRELNEKAGVPQDYYAHGEFYNAETGVRFEWFQGVPEALSEIPDATHTIFLSADVIFPYRAARVLKTVAYIAVDEDENGIVWEKWDIKRYRNYIQ